MIRNHITVQLINLSLSTIFVFLPKGQSAFTHVCVTMKASSLILHIKVLIMLITRWRSFSELKSFLKQKCEHVICNIMKSFSLWAHLRNCKKMFNWWFLLIKVNKAACVSHLKKRVACIKIQRLEFQLREPEKHLKFVIYFQSVTVLSIQLFKEHFSLQLFSA